MNYYNNQKNESKKDFQEQEENHDFYPSSVINIQNQETTEAGGGPPTPPNSNLQPTNSESSQNSIPKPEKSGSTPIPIHQSENADSIKISEEVLDCKTKAKKLIIEESKLTETNPINDIPIKEQNNQEELYENCQSQSPNNEQSNLMDIEEDIQTEYNNNLATTETGYETKSNLTESYQNYVLESFNQKKNPNISIPIQSWEKEPDDLLLFDKYFDNSDERLTLYDIEGEEANNGDT